MSYFMIREGLSHSVTFKQRFIRAKGKSHAVTLGMGSQKKVILKFKLVSEKNSTNRKGD